MVNSLSIDLGRNGAYVLWQDQAIRKIVPFEIESYVTQHSWKLIRRIIRDIIRHDITKIYVEKTSRRLAFAWFLYQDVRGLAFDKDISQDLDFLDIHPIHMKKVVTDNGRAKKDLILETINVLVHQKAFLNKTKVNLKDVNEHIADAVGIGLTGMIDEGIVPELY